MPDGIRSLAIRSHVTVGDHVEYGVQVTGADGRVWTISKRYQQFADLHAELSKEVRAAVPCELPGKRSIFASWSRASVEREEAFVRDRQTALETYLRTLLGHSDARFRNSHAFCEFLNVPVVSAAHPHLSAGSTSFSTSSWLEEHDALQAMVRSARADINRRDTLAKQGDVTGAQQAGVDGKRKLATLLGRLTILARGLDDLAVATAMVEGEVRRRADMVTRLQDESETLGKLAIAARSAPATSRLATGRTDASPTARADLLGSGRPAAGSSGRPGRALGAKAAPVETDATRPLDNAGLLQLQQEQMSEQDARVSSLSAVVRRQRELAIAINRELGEQNEMLDDLDQGVDKFGAKMKKAQGQLKKLGS